MQTRHETVEFTVANSNKAVDFANKLLAKHEANMKRREKEGLYPPASPTPPSKTDNNHGQQLQMQFHHNHQVVSSFINHEHHHLHDHDQQHQYAFQNSEEGVEHFRSLQRVDELNESLENLNSARSQARNNVAAAANNVGHLAAMMSSGKR